MFGERISRCLSKNFSKLASNLMTIMDQRILIFVGDVYEDLELWYPKLRLIEAGVDVVVAGSEAGRSYQGKNGYPCIADASLASVREADFTGLVVPGGFMPDKLRRDPRVLQLVRDFAESEKLVAAVCHGGQYNGTWPHS